MAYRRKLLGDRTARFLSVGGATASGLRMDRVSKTGALDTFLGALIPEDPGLLPVLQLGEIDCGFIIWYRADKYKESVESQLHYSLNNYLVILKTIRDAGYGRRMIVTSAVPPTILDGQLEGEVASARSAVTASLKDRTALTLEFNAHLKTRCDIESIRYVDIASDFLDAKTGLIADKFRHPNVLDHHLNPRTAGPVWFKAISTAADAVAKETETLAQGV
jgi:hypothetical protein